MYLCCVLKKQKTKQIIKYKYPQTKLIAGIMVGWCICCNAHKHISEALMSSIWFCLGFFSTIVFKKTSLLQIVIFLWGHWDCTVQKSFQNFATVSQCDSWDRVVEAQPNLHSMMSWICTETVFKILIAATSPSQYDVPAQ